MIYHFQGKLDLTSIENMSHQKLPLNNDTLLAMRNVHKYTDRVSSKHVPLRVGLSTPRGLMLLVLIVLLLSN